jgi:hypothetical protein
VPTVQLSPSSLLTVCKDPRYSTSSALLAKNATDRQDQGATAAHDRDRVGLLKFNLSTVKGPLTKATLSFDGYMFVDGAYPNQQAPASLTTQVSSATSWPATTPTFTNLPGASALTSISVLRNPTNTKLHGLSTHFDLDVTGAVQQALSAHPTWAGFVLQNTVGTPHTYSSFSNPVLTLTLAPATIFTVEFDADQLARACAGGVGVDGVHDFTITGVAKRDDGTLVTNTELKFSFENNKGHDYGDGGKPKKAKFIPDVLKGQSATPDGLQMTASTDADGKVSVHVLSSDIISSDIEIKIKWTDAQGQDKDVGSKACDFVAVVSKRRFPDPNDPNDPDWQANDTGWICDTEQLVDPGNTTPAKVYIKFIKNSVLGDVNGNWHFINDHRLRMKIAKVVLCDGTEITDEIALVQYLAIVRSDGTASTWAEVISGAVPNTNGERDGAAQVMVKAGELIWDVDEIEFDAEDLT